MEELDKMAFQAPQELEVILEMLVSRASAEVAEDSKG